VDISSQGALSVRFQSDATRIIAPWFSRLLRLFIGDRVGETLRIISDVVTPLSEDMDAACLRSSLARIARLASR